MFKIFISYSRKRQAIAQRLCKRLEEVGYNVFIDNQILAGEDWGRRIVDELNNAHAVIALWDNHTVDSQPVIDECRRANKLQKLIPILIEEVSLDKLPFQLASIQYLEMFLEEDFERGESFDKLMRAIIRLCDPERLLKDLRQQDSTTELKPIKPDSTDSVSVQLIAVIDDLENGQIRIPAYQREDNQWDLETKSLFVESIINNLPVPAFFFEPQSFDGLPGNYVVDGQQRLSVIRSYFRDEFALMDAETTPYISAQADHYRGRRFSELHPVFQNAFKKYQLTIMKVRDLGDQRLEIFRRINRGGTPLSAHDIRLAYYSASSRTINFIKLVGITDPSKPSSRRTIAQIEKDFDLSYPWSAADTQKHWQAFWAKGSVSLGQRASEMFLWALVAADLERAMAFLPTEAKASPARAGERGLDAVLDMYCEQLASRDKGSSVAIMPLAEIQNELCPLFGEMVRLLFRKPHMVPQNAVKIGITLGAMYRCGIRVSSERKVWNHVPDYISTPNRFSQKLRLGKIALGSKWLGVGGYLNYIENTRKVMEHLHAKA